MNDGDDSGLTRFEEGSYSKKQRRRRREIDPDSPRDVEAHLDGILREELIRQERFSRQN